MNWRPAAGGSVQRHLLKGVIYIGGPIWGLGGRRSKSCHIWMKWLLRRLICSLGPRFPHLLQDIPKPRPKLCEYFSAFFFTFLVAHRVHSELIVAAHLSTPGIGVVCDWFMRGPNDRNVVPRSWLRLPRARKGALFGAM